MLRYRRTRKRSGWSGAGVLGWSWAGGVAYAYGRTDGARSVDVGHRGTWHRVPVGDNGWWLVLVAADEGELLDLHRVPRPRGAPRGEPRIAG